MAVALFVLPFCCLCASPPLPKRHQVSVGERAAEAQRHRLWERRNGCRTAGSGRMGMVSRSSKSCRGAHSRRRLNLAGPVSQGWAGGRGPLIGVASGVCKTMTAPHAPNLCLQFIGPLDLSPDAYARTTSAANVAQQQQQLKYANAAAASSYGSQLGLLAAAGASPYASAANSPLGVRAVASPQLLLSPRVTLSPAGSLHSPRSPGAGAGYVIYSNPAAVYPLNSAGGYPPAIQAHGSAATTPPGFGDGASPAAEDAQLAQQQQQLVQQQQLAQQQPQLQQQDQLEHMQAQQRQQMQAFMQQQMQGAGGQPMLPHPHLGGRTYH